MFNASARGLGLADLEPAGRFGGGAGGLGEQVVTVVDPEGVVRALHHYGAAGVDHADVDTLPGHDERTADSRPAGCPAGLSGRVSGRVVELHLIRYGSASDDP